MSSKIWYNVGKYYPNFFTCYLINMIIISIIIINFEKCHFSLRFSCSLFDKYFLIWTSFSLFFLIINCIISLFFSFSGKSFKFIDLTYLVIINLTSSKTRYILTNILIIKCVDTLLYLFLISGDKESN